MRKAALPIPYIIALIFGIIALAVLGYWLFMQSGKISGTGIKTECDANRYNFCLQWKVALFRFEPPFSGGCPKPTLEECANFLKCECKYAIPAPAYAQCPNDRPISYVLDPNKPCSNYPTDAQLCCE